MRDQSVSANTARGMQCVQLVAYVPRGTRGGKMDSAVRHRPCVPITADACCQHGGSSTELGDRRGEDGGTSFGAMGQNGVQEQGAPTWSRPLSPGVLLLLLFLHATLGGSPALCLPGSQPSLRRARQLIWGLSEKPALQSIYLSILGALVKHLSH